MNIKYFKILSTILLLILFSLSCDTTEPTAPVVQDSDYLVSIASAVEKRLNAPSKGFSPLG